MRGVIKKLVADRGFGFIKQEKGPDHFFHHSGMAEGVQFEDLVEGRSVEFDSEKGPKGPRASQVRPV